jgi:integrase
MRWDQVNLDRAEWRIPTTKNGRPHTIPLLSEAITVLRRRKPGPKAEHDPSHEYVFPGSGADHHLTEPKKGWRRILDRAELYQLTKRIAAAKGWSVKQLEDARSATNATGALERARSAVKTLGEDPDAARIVGLRIHDLRRTLGSWQAVTGASLPIIGKTLAHENANTTAIYARLDLNPVKQAMEKAAAAMFAAGAQKKAKPSAGGMW